jgi:hypothetical protein
MWREEGGVGAEPWVPPGAERAGAAPASSFVDICAGATLASSLAGTRAGAASLDTGRESGVLFGRAEPHLRRISFSTRASSESLKLDESQWGAGARADLAPDREGRRRPGRR